MSHLISHTVPKSFVFASYQDLGKLSEVCVFCYFFVDVKVFSVASSSFQIHRCESSNSLNLNTVYINNDQQLIL